MYIIRVGRTVLIPDSFGTEEDIYGEAPGLFTIDNIAQDNQLERRNILIGGVVGGVVVILCLVLVIIFMCRRYRRTRRLASEDHRGVVVEMAKDGKLGAETNVLDDNTNINMMPGGRLRYLKENPAGTEKQNLGDAKDINAIPSGRLRYLDQSGLSVPNRTVPYIPPSIRFGSRSKIPSGEAIRLANVRYGSVRFEDVRYGEPSLIGTGVEEDAQRLGRQIILSSSIPGTPRYMKQLYQDAMTICRHYGRPEFFVTFTCNPK